MSNEQVIPTNVKHPLVLLREAIRHLVRERSYRIVVVDNGKRRPLAGMRTVTDPTEAQRMLDTLRSYGTDDEFDVEEVDD